MKLTSHFRVSQGEAVWVGGALDPVLSLANASLGPGHHSKSVRISLVSTLRALFFVSFGEICMLLKCKQL